MIKAVFFDAIDTLFGAYPDKIGMYVRVIKEETGLSVNREKMTEVWNRIVIDTEEAAAREISSDGNLAWEGFNKRILELLDYKKKDIDEAGKRVLREVWSNPENFVLFNDVRPALDLLHLRKIRVACVSNENDKLVNFFEHFDIKNDFEQVFTSESVGFEKPNPKFFEFALKNMELKPNEVIHVGDSIVSDYYGAQLAHIQPILIDRDRKVRKNIRVVNNLTDIKKYLE